MKVLHKVIAINKWEDILNISTSRNNVIRNKVFETSWLTIVRFKIVFSTTYNKLIYQLL